MAIACEAPLRAKLTDHLKTWHSKKLFSNPEAEWLFASCFILEAPQARRPDVSVAEEPRALGVGCYEGMVGFAVSSLRLC